MYMQKANWVNDGGDIRLNMPITKVDAATRQVSGWASLDNIDGHRDLVDAVASREAFSTFRGNVREQHDEKKAIGKLVDFKEDVFYNQKDDKFYQGIYVTAYVSKGAQDTWEKVLDGTLSGFSIGGNVLEFENEIDETGSPFRRVKKYSLSELSLVDNPANQLANVISFAKVNGETKMTGDIADLKVENIFVCNNCLDLGHGVHKSGEESLACPVCNGKMIKIGFVESSDDDQKLTIKKMVDDHLADREGGVEETMANKTEEVTETEEVVEETTAPEEEVTNVPNEEAPVQQEEEAPAEEETQEEENKGDDLPEAISALRELTERIERSNQAREEEVNTLRKSFDDLDKRFDERLNTIAGDLVALQERQDEFTKKFEGIDGTFAEMQKSLDGIESATAFKKSADFDQSAEEENSEDDGPWKGSFLNIGSF